MKSILSLAMLAVFVCGLAAASGGDFVWRDELQRPEAQQAIQQYIQEHCQGWIVQQNFNDALNNKSGDIPIRVQISCWARQSK
jgi:hypothetical protein